MSKFWVKFENISLFIILFILMNNSAFENYDRYKSMLLLNEQFISEETKNFFE